MAGISLGAALLGSAVIGGATSAAGAAKNAGAIKNASQQTTADNAAARELQEKVYNQNYDTLSPFVARGNVAGDSINALLGLPTAAEAPQPGGGRSDYASYVQANPDLLAEYQRAPMQWGSLSDYGKFHYDTYGQGEGRTLPGVAAANGVASAVTPVTARNAFDNYLNSTGYKFQLGEANKNANSMLAATGALDSGAAVKSAQDRGQNIATGFFNNYLGLLGNQQGVGLSGASAIAGVGQNYANSMGNLYGQNSQNAWNTANAKVNNTNDLLSGLSSSFGVGLGALTKFK